MTNIEIFYPINVDQWRKWLSENHLIRQSVWIVFYKKSSNKDSITWREAVDVALCFGWIDSKKIKIDEVTSHQFFSKRKAQSTWSKINKDVVEQLIADNLMEKAGYDSIQVAKLNGSWTILDEVEALIIPSDLEEAFNKYSNSKDYFMSLSKSAKKILLSWIVLAKRPETRQKRINEIALCAGENRKPDQF